INEAMQLLRLSKRSQDIQFENLCHDSLYLLGDAQRLVQVFVNLLSNARDASRPGQTIRVDAEADKHQLVVRVVDEGHGVPAEKLDRIFEPFYTTIDVGNGTGLGLSLVYSIVEEHYGHIAIECPVSNGRVTCVKVSLLRYHPEPVTESSEPAA